uniref:Lactotransferrin n=1 Tax=Cercocebus atys TaxID=9531 RepID=A0A2K5NHS3_CERAT
MKLVFLALLFLGTLGLCLAARRRSVRWCAVSQPEAKKCSQWQRNLRGVRGPPVSCIKRASPTNCIQAIAANRADAMTLDGGLMYEAGLAPHKLRPVAAEVYGTEEKPRTHYYAVAVVKKGSGFQLNELQGLKSCHTGLNRTAGWNVPIGMLRPFLNWTGPPEPIEAAVARFFSASCVPGADEGQFPNLCRLCVGTGENKCAFSSQEPYFSYSGAFKCLRDGAGDVAFIRESTVFEDLSDPAERDNYELLCPDNTRKPVDKFQECHLARVPSHAVVARSVNGKEDAIWELLRQSQEKFGKDKSPAFQLFGSPRGQKDLLFKDSAIGFSRVPPRIDSGLYLGSGYLTAIQNLKKSEEEVAARRARVVWCAVGQQELEKCDQWSALSEGNVNCSLASTADDCIALKGEADAMSLDGGYVYTAGKCGLVPVLAENYSKWTPLEPICRASWRLRLVFLSSVMPGYLAVAVVRNSDTGLTWNSLKGKKSCHTAVDRTAGWNIPIGLLFNQTGSCKFGKESQRRGGWAPLGGRCLAENAGDVAFVKDVTVLQNTDGKNTEAWAKDLKLNDFQLLCLDGTRKPVTEARSCHLATAPNHAVVSRTDKVERLKQVLFDQQAKFGKNGSDCPGTFCLFQSKTKNLLFNDNTECLARLHGKTTYEKYLGPQYVTAITNLKKCSSSPLLEACAFLQK